MTLPPVKKCSGLNQERNLHRLSSVYKPKQFWTNTCVDYDLRNNRRWTFSLEETLLWIRDKKISVDYLWIIVISAVWTLILTAPIHCRGSIGEQVIQCYISPNLIKKLTWGCVNFQQIFIFGWTNPLFIRKPNHSLYANRCKKDSKLQFSKQILHQIKLWVTF